jgi:2-oxoglutarate ferredoxin oxidoreductase subunit alpha
VKSVSIAMTGSGGAGVMTAGQMFLDAVAQAGWFGLMTRSSGPQIRGGEAAAFLYVSPDDVRSPGDVIDIMLAIDWMNVERFAAELPLGPASVVIGDPSAGEAPEVIRKSGARLVDVPLKELCKDIAGGRPNMVGLGLVAALVGLPEAAVAAVIDKALKRKGPEAVASSVAAIKKGVEAAGPLGADFRVEAEKGAAKVERWNISGNEATGLGAVRGGVRFCAAYPITPGTEILEWLAPNLRKVGGALVQAEDELASVNMIIGASFGGVPSITATAGPGLALMMESIGLAVASETPIVVVDVQRGGPSTGIPTKSEQSDLNIAVYGLHGDAPHLVTAANSIGDCLFTAQWSVHLAEALQAPVIMLTDQSLGQSRAIIRKPAELAFIARREVAPAEVREYRRYAVTASGVSPMAIPGTPGGEYVADGLEHTPRGVPSSQASDHQAQLDKRARKLAAFDYGNHWADVVGEGDTAIVTWGSATGPAWVAMERAAEAGLKVKLVSLRLILPAQVEKFRTAMAGVKRVLVVEQSHGRQFLHYLRAHYDLPGEVKCFAQPGPLPIRPGQVYDQLINWS